LLLRYLLEHRPEVLAHYRASRRPRRPLKRWAIAAAFGSSHLSLVAFGLEALLPLTTQGKPNKMHLARTSLASVPPVLYLQNAAMPWSL